MLKIRIVKPEEKNLIDEIVTIHLNTFTGFFLTFMGRGFLNQLYRSYCEDENSGLIVAEKENQAVGFLAYSGNLSELYKHMLRKRFFQFAWYSIGAFFRKPSAFMHIVRAFLKPSESKREEKYVELASIGVKPYEKTKGVGSHLIDALKARVDFTEYAYITLETDVIDNEIANSFYKKNGFYIAREFVTCEGRQMYEYRYDGG